MPRGSWTISEDKYSVITNNVKYIVNLVSS